MKTHHLNVFAFINSPFNALFEGALDGVVSSRTRLANSQPKL